MHVCAIPYIVSFETMGPENDDASLLGDALLIFSNRVSICATIIHVFSQTTYRVSVSNTKGISGACLLRSSCAELLSTGSPFCCSLLLTQHASTS